MNVFIDTSAFYALLSKTDLNHTMAADRWRDFLADSEVRLFTSNYVVVETCALVNNRLGRSAVGDFAQALLPATTVLWVEEHIHRAAMEAMLVTGSGGPSLVDCSSFALMRAGGLAKAFAFDKHFDAQQA